jgi:hypothetical protein
VVCCGYSHAVASALAASALPALVMARGHKIDTVPELPLVVSNDVEGITKTAKAVELLVKVRLPHIRFTACTPAAHSAVACALDS